MLTGCSLAPATQGPGTVENGTCYNAASVIEDQKLTASQTAA